MKLTGKKTLKFTLVEMLIVIGIIAVLVSLLLPMIQKSISLARTVECSNNLKQMGILYHAWADEHHGFQVGYTRFHCNLGVMEGLGSTQDEVYNNVFYNKWTKKTRPEYYETIYSCPEALDDHKSGTDYYGWRLDYSLRRWSGKDRKIRVPRFKTPSKTFIIIDSRGYWYLEYGHGGAYYDQKAISNRHNGLTNILFCDGHVETYPAQDDPAALFNIAVVGVEFWKDYWP